MRTFTFGLMIMVGATLSFASCGKSDKDLAATAGSAGLAGEAPTGEDGGSAGQAGGGGDGMVAVPPPVACGAEMCTAISGPGGALAPCCVDPQQAICGADLGALSPTMGCQRLNQPGALDPSCPTSAGGMAAGFPLPTFPGCCREDTGQCGVLVSDLGGLLPFSPGCVDASPFTGNTTPKACGTQGAGGASAGGAGAGGEPAAAGAAGALGSGGDAGNGGAASIP